MNASMLQRKGPARKARAYHKGNVAHDLLAVAARILTTERVEDISVRRLAREVGVTPANFYNHFPSLDALLLTVAAQGFDEVTHNSARIIAKVKNKKEALLQMSVQFVEFALANKQVFRIMFGQIPNSIAYPPFKQAADASFGQLVNFIYGREIYDPSDLRGVHSKGRAAYAVFSMIYGLARNIIEDQFEFATGSRAEIRQFVEDVMGTLFDDTLVTTLAENP